MRRSAAVTAAALAVALGASFVACRGATQITLTVRTNVPCDQLKGVSVYVGAPGLDVETKAPTLTTSACDASGQVGSLVIVPTGARDDAVGIRVVAGIARQSEDCAANQYTGCIVARRALRFSPHESLDAIVALTRDCVGQACDLTHSCVAGSCVDSRDTAPPALPDGAPAAPTVRCGDNGARCALTGDVCCLTVDVDAGTTTGACKPSGQCGPNDTSLLCDDESDCPGRDDAGQPNICCVQYTVAPADNSQHPNHVSGAQCMAHDACLPQGGLGLELCEERVGCFDRTLPCEQATEALPGYFWCKVPHP